MLDGMTPARIVDSRAGWLGVVFVVTLLVGESLVSLPDEHATDLAVARFYAAHRGVIILLQLVGFLSCALLGAFARRLRVVDRVVATVGVVLAVAAAVPGVITIVLALVADPLHPLNAGMLNRLEPRGDDVLFVGATAFAVAIAVRLGRGLPWLGGVAAAVAFCCVLRLVLEALGAESAAMQTLAPVAFLALMVVLTVLAFRGLPAHRSGSP
jgi:hypothetical protein